MHTVSPLSLSSANTVFLPDEDEPAVAGVLDTACEKWH
jgi:hypothetical protein